MRQIRIALTLALSLPVLLNCSGGDDDGDDTKDPIDAGFILPDAGFPPDSGPRDAGFRDAGPRDAGMIRRDENDTIATAQMAMVNQQMPIRAVINPAGDRDFYKLDMTEGQYLIAITDTVASGTTRADTVLRLYDSSETLVAENDDAFPRVDVDSELIYRIPATGTYYVEVLEWSDWSPDSTGTEGGALFTYSLVLRTLSDRNEGVNVDLETGDMPADALALEYTANNFAQIAGTFEDTTDIDYFTATFTTGGSLGIDRMPAGPMGYGSTTTGGRLIVTNVDTSSVTASLDLSNSSSLQMPLQPGNYLISIDHAGDVEGANDFYFLKSGTGGDNPPAPPEPNDTVATAGALTLADDGSGSGTRVAFLLTTIEDGDVDVFSFDVAAGELPSAVCGGQSSGSGVRGLTLEILDSAETVIGMSTEMPPDIAFVPQTMSAPGTHYFRISKASQDPMVDGNWVRCAVRAGPMN